VVKEKNIVCNYNWFLEVHEWNAIHADVIKHYVSCYKT